MRQGVRDGGPSRWEELPDEILLQIISYLEPYHITRLQLVSRRLQKLCLDNELWRRHCFENSPWYRSLVSRRELFDSHDLFADAPDVSLEDGDRGADFGYEPLRPSRGQLQKLQDMANWDPSFPGESISWYDEYIQRNGPACVNWFETPRMKDRGIEAIIEARGLALYSPYDGHDGQGTMLAVSPLDDGSVCLWDVNGSRGRQGQVLAKSAPDILFIDGPGVQNARRSKRIDTGVTECVSVSNNGHRAFFAVQSHLIEVDLNRLDVVSRESFEWSITTLSSVDDGVPLTVGTTLGIHLHDFRARASVRREVVERLDQPLWQETDIFKSIFDTKPLPPYASLSQPTPISILHLPRPGSLAQVSDDIYVAGRFSNILHYERRKFPSIVGSIHSGGLIQSLAALPYPFSALDSEVRRRGELSTEQVAQSKATGRGLTMIAGGSYNMKGSLEVYGLGPADGTGSTMLQNSTMKNRQTAATATILSVTNHGSKIVFSDGAGLINWFERDGTTECRRLKIGHGEGETPGSLFASMPATDDLARKVLSTQSARGENRPNNDNVLFWTGEKLGLVTFTTEPVCAPPGPAAPKAGESEEEEEEEARRLYSDRMRQALERQANDVRFVSHLGLGGRMG